MWNWFRCYLSGRHEFGVWCEPGAIFLRCVHCGRRSSGWSVETRAEAPPLAAGAKRMAKTTALAPARVLPFDRAAS
jgi:hypothetical protein